MVPRNTLFEVYESSRSQKVFAVGQDGDHMILLDENNAGTYKVSRLVVVQAVAKIAARLRAGYVRRSTLMHFDASAGRFCVQTPELSKSRGEWVLAAAPHDMAAAIKSVEEVARKLPQSAIFTQEVDFWVASCERATSYVVAPDDIPHWSLIIAQLSLEKGWPLRSSPGLDQMPDTPPSMGPGAWATWLSKTFSDQSISDAQRALGWTVEHIIISGSHVPDEGNLSAYL